VSTAQCIIYNLLAKDRHCIFKSQIPLR